ncbi:MAG: hypothetical protein P8Y12_07905 [Gammaproteobacteria bacterium]|jgi:hypothetical protein
MNLKTITDNLLMLGALAAAAYGLYYYLNGPKEPAKATARYQENEQETRFDQLEESSGSLDDCYRYSDPNSIEACIERRTKADQQD